jgi:hypothetical protein
VKLGTLLLRNAAIGLTQLEGALRNQVLYGGRLGTNLVELGFLDLEMLSGYLAELSGLPVATPSILDAAELRLLERLGADDAHDLRAIPLAFLPDGTAAVAFVEPADRETIEAVAARLGARVTPYIVPELRALYYLEKHFGLPRRPRFVRPGRSDTESEPMPERRRLQPAGGIAMPPALTLEPRRKRPSAELPAAVAARGPAAVAFEAACERIDAAPHRERIADVFAEYARGRFDALAIFLIRDGNAIGWRGYVAPVLLPAGSASSRAAAALAPPKTPIEELSLPLGGASSLQSAHDTVRPFAGPPPATVHPTETRLWAALGSTEPAGVIVVPISVKQRVVNLVYAHTLGGLPPQQLVDELTELAGRAQASYLRLIRRARGA